MASIQNSFSGAPVEQRDAFWLHKKKPILSVLISLANKFTNEEIQQLFDRIIISIPRFSQVVVSNDRGELYWKTDSNITQEHHVSFLENPPDERMEFLKLISELRDKPVDMTHPLWGMKVIQFKDHTKLFLRVHHAISDGQGLISALARVTDEETPQPTANFPPKPSLGTEIINTLSIAKKVLWPQVGIPNILNRSDKIKDAAIDWMDPCFPLNDLKAIGQKLPGENHATINDVLLTIISGGLQRFLLSTGVEEQELRKILITAFIAISARPSPTNQGETKNDASAVALSIDLNDIDPIDRMGHIHEGTMRIKHSLALPICIWLKKTLSHLSFSTDEAICNELIGQRTMFISNLRGPTQPVSIEGNKIKDFHFFTQPDSPTVLDIKAMSYNGNLYVSLTACTETFPDTTILKKYIQEEYQNLFNI